MASQAPRTSGFSIGAVIARGFAVMAAAPVPVFGIALLLGALPKVALSYLTTLYQQQGLSRDGFLGVTALYVLSWLVGLVLSMVVLGAVTQAVLRHAEGSRAGFADILMTGATRALPLIALAILSGLAIGVGLVLLIVPGLMLLVMWTVAAPALVAERVGVFGALGRSRELTRGVRWPVFGLEVLLWIFAGMANSMLSSIFLGVFGLSGFASTLSGGSLGGWFLVSAIVQTLIVAVGASVHGALYVELRHAREGPSTGNLAAIFG